MEGRKAETLSVVQDVAVTVPVPMLLAMQQSGWGLAEQYAALVRFGLWDELIALQQPGHASAGADRRLPVRAGRGACRARPRG